MTFISALITLYLIIGPFGSMPLILSLLPQSRNNRREYRRIIIREGSLAFCILLCFLLAGNVILQAMQVSQASLGIAGGVVVFIIALRMVFPMPGNGLVGDSTLSEKPLLVPIAIPVIAGPGAMTMVMLLGASEPERQLEWTGVVAAACFLSIMTLLTAPWLSRLLGERVLKAVERLTGMILVTIAVEMILTGVKTMLIQAS